MVRVLLGRQASFTLLACALATATMFPVSVGAQNRALTEPSTLPPADYNGAYWVDSRGCRYIRNLVGGPRKWIPQVRIDGQPICDAKSGTYIADPSVGRNTGAPLEAATPAPKPAAPQPAPTPSVASTPLNSNIEVNLLDDLPAAGPGDNLQQSSAGTNTNLLDALPPPPNQAPVAAAPVAAAPAEIQAPAEPKAAPAPEPAPAPASVVAAPKLAAPAQAPEPAESAPAPQAQSPAVASNVFVQVGNYGKRIDVGAIVSQPEARGYNVISERPGSLTTVLIAAPASASGAEALQNQIRAIGFPSAFITRR